MIAIDTRVVKASFRENPTEERKRFPQSTCLMPISVGQSIHEGAKFEAVIKLIGSAFKHCTVLVDDSVQRHTLSIIKQENPDKLYQLAVQEGDDWLARNHNALNKLAIPFEIMRWDDWFNTAGYLPSYNKVKQLYDSNVSYREAIHANIEDFLSRYLKNFLHIEVDKDRAEALCLDYLLEECAVMCLWTEKFYDFEIYPSGRNKAMAATYEQLIKPLYPDYLRPVALRFKKYPGLSSNNSFAANAAVGAFEMSE